MPEKPEVIQNRDKRWPCVVLFTRLVITFDGKVRFCPDDWMKTSTIADINHNTLSEIWNGEILNSIRQKHLSGDYSKSHVACKDCTDWKVIEWGNDYSVALNDLF